MLFSFRQSAGVDGIFGDRQVGIGLLYEVGFLPKLSVAAGLQYSIMDGPRSPDGRAFYQRQDFPPGLPNLPDSQFADIRTNFSILQIPVRLYFTLPLIRGFGVRMMAGSNIDIYARYHADYIIRDFLNPAVPGRRSNADEQLPVRMLNNVMFGIGVEKNWGRFAVQALPYVNPVLTNVLYRRNEMNPGVNAGVRFNF
jgi:hypothetical protein